MFSLHVHVIGLGLACAFACDARSPGHALQLQQHGERECAMHKAATAAATRTNGAISASVSTWNFSSAPTMPTDTFFNDRDCKHARGLKQQHDKLTKTLFCRSTHLLVRAARVQCSDSVLNQLVT